MTVGTWEHKKWASLVIWNSSSCYDILGCTQKKPSCRGGQCVHSWGSGEINDNHGTLQSIGQCDNVYIIVQKSVIFALAEL